MKEANTRRHFLKLAAGTAIFSPWAAKVAGSTTPERETKKPSELAGASGVVKRLLPDHAGQIDLLLALTDGSESFRVEGSAGRIQIKAPTTSALLMGLGGYLKYSAGVSASWNGDCLNRLPADLPAPTQPVTGTANVKHRFALNDTNDGYTGPYWTWERWEKLIDILALHGVNEMLVYAGAEAVYQRTFQKFGFDAKAMRLWLPTPAHQPWWLLENMSAWVGPSTSQHLVNDRAALARKITDRLRELGMTPVLPGYFGILPDGFSKHRSAARVIPQGKWLGIKRPDWLDPTCDVFGAVAAEYYRAQAELLGPSSMFKMDPMHEGGESGKVNIASAAGAIDRELQKAHPGSIWTILGWQENPRGEVLAGIRNKQNALILDGQADRYEYKDREQQWNDTPYAFGTIWNFGGHTTMGANVGVWNQRYFDQLKKPGSRLAGIALLPEASCNNPAAFAFFTEMAWRSGRTDLDQWFADWSRYRYGGEDSNAARAWDILHRTAYDMKSGAWSEAHDSLYSAQPSLTAKSACSWSPLEPRYDLAVFSQAVASLMGVDRSLRNSSAYRYDLVDVVRQAIANHSRVLLPQIDQAYSAKDLTRFRGLTRTWLEQIRLLDRVAGTEPALLLGEWLAEARAAAVDSTEEGQLEFDARSLLLEWGPESSRGSGVHDYANREWSGLLEYYGQRWATYFNALEAALAKQEAVRTVDWFAMDEDFAKQRNSYPGRPQEDFYQVIEEIIRSGAALGIDSPLEMRFNAE